MRTFKNLILCFMLIGTGIANASMMSVEGYFSQSGFDGGGSVSGFFRGIDENGDGQLSSVSPFLNFVTGVNVSNELDYAEITFNGTGTSLGSQTLIYDKSVADVFEMQNFFFGFVYNIDSGRLGDEANEGFSFSPFAPSTNYLLGDVFKSLFIGSLDGVGSSDFGVCDGVIYCAAVLELVPDVNGVDGIRTVSQSLSRASVEVPAPHTFGLFSLMLFGAFLKQRHQKD